MQEIIDQYISITINLNLLTEFYKNQLLTSEIPFKYLLNRGIEQETIHKFNLGYCAGDYELYDYLGDHLLDTDKLVEVGVLSKDTNDVVHEKMVERIVFPIYDLNGDTIAFSGRTLNDNPIKYLNSPNSPVFRKSFNLYGLYHAYKEIEERKFVLIVEGNLDVLSISQTGLFNVVAPLGTALTKEQVLILKHFTNNIFTWFDNDNAGQKATERAVELLKSVGVNHYVLPNVEGIKDANEFLQKYPKTEFFEIVKSSQRV